MGANALHQAHSKVNLVKVSLISAVGLVRCERLGELTMPAMAHFNRLITRTRLIASMLILMSQPKWLAATPLQHRIIYRFGVRRKSARRNNLIAGEL
jgi:hypothetical protein